MTRILAVLLLASLNIFAITKPTLPQLQVDTTMPTVTGKSITVAAGADLQTAINNAAPGDELVLQAGATWTGSYHLPNKQGAGSIILRSSAVAKLPPPGNRVAPTDAPNMATIQAYSVNVAFQLDPGAHNYYLLGLEITEQPKQSLNYGLIMAGDPNDTNPADLPNHITLDRCYVHGRPLSHIKFGWQMNGTYLAAINNYFSDFHGLGQDTQAITGYMGQGPFLISNNFLSGAGENVLFGGAYDAIPNTTTADVTFTNNYLYKPPSWAQPLIPSPTGVTATASAGGSLAPATYYYSVIAAGTLGTLDSLPGQAQGARSTETSVVVGADSGTATVQFKESTYGDATDTRLADNYIVCRTTDPPGGNRAWTYFHYTPAPNTPLAFKDDGTATADPGFGEWVRTWSVKNLFEIKNGTRWLVDGNVMENNWVSSQNGFSILFTPRNEMPQSMPGNRVQDITFTNNIVRHVAGGFNIGSEDDTAPLSVINPALVTARIYIANNLVEDIGYTYGNNGIAMQFGAGAYPTLPGVQDLTFNHNTFFQSWSNAGLGPADPAHPENRIGHFTYENNILQAGAYDWHFNSGGFDWATSILPNFDGIDTHNNVWAGAPASAHYPTNNMWPNSLADVGFTNYNNGNGGDYHLAAGSPYKGKADDGTDPGADIDKLAVVNTSAIGGLAAQAPAPPPVQVPPPATTTSPTIWFQVASVNSAKCLTAQADMSLAQMTCDSTNTGQWFSLIPAFDASQKLVGYQFLNYGGSSMDVWTGSGANGTPIGLYKFKGSPNELFTIKNGKGQMVITANNSNSCLDIPGLLKTDGVKLQEWGCNGGANQAWTISIATIQ